jgi:hypothetical protein
MVLISIKSLRAELTLFLSHCQQLSRTTLCFRGLSPLVLPGGRKAFFPLLLLLQLLVADRSKSVLDEGRRPET